MPRNDVGWPGPDSKNEASLRRGSSIDPLERVDLNSTQEGSHINWDAWDQQASGPSRRGTIIDNLGPHPATSPTPAPPPFKLVSLETYCKRWSNGLPENSAFTFSPTGLLDVLDICVQVARINLDLLSCRLAHVICRPDYFTVRLVEGEPPFVQLQSFAGVLKLPGFDGGLVVRALATTTKGDLEIGSQGSNYLERQALDLTNLAYMSTDLFNRDARDGAQEEPASVYSCGVLFKNLLIRQMDGVDPEPEDDFGRVEAIYRHLRRGSEEGLADTKMAAEEASDPATRILLAIVVICLEKEPSLRYSYRTLLYDLRQVELVVTDQQAAGEVRLNQGLYHEQQEVLIDRSTEIQMLDESFDEVRASREMRVLHVWGTSGSGKSLLVEEWQSSVRKRSPEVFVAGVKLDPNTNQPLPSFVGIFEALLTRVSESDPSGLQWDWKTEVGALLKHQPKIAQLLSKDWRRQLLDEEVVSEESEQNRDWSIFMGRTMVACKRLLQLFTIHATCVFILDDVQWMSHDEMQLWRSVLNDGARLLNLQVISIHRSSTVPPPSLCLTDDSVSIEARPLSPEGIARYLMKSFRWEIEPSLLTSVIWDETRGNAFYVRRLIRLLVDHVFDYDFAKLVWNVDLSLLSFYARHDGIDKFVARAIADVPEECLAILQTLSFLPTRDVQTSLLQAYHPSLVLQPILAEASRRGILRLNEDASTAKWAHDKFREASRETVREEGRRAKHASIGHFLARDPAFLFDAADNLLASRDGLPVTQDTELGVLLCNAATASLRASVRSADQYLTAAASLMDFKSDAIWAAHPETCFVYIFAKAEIDTKLQRIDQQCIDEIAAALPKCNGILQELQVYTTLVRMCTGSMPETAIRFARQGLDAAGFSWSDERLPSLVPSTAEEFERIQRMVNEPVVERGEADLKRMAAGNLLAHTYYVTFFTLPLDEQFRVTSLGVWLGTYSAACLQTSAAAYALSYRGHQLSMMLRFDEAERHDEIGRQLVDQLPGNPLEADTRLTLDLQLHHRVPLATMSKSYSVTWDCCLSTGNMRMLGFVFILGVSNQVSANTLLVSPTMNALCNDFPGWEEWLPLLGSQANTFAAALQVAITNVKSPGACNEIGYPLNGALSAPELEDPANPLTTNAIACVQMHVALMLGASTDVGDSILDMGERSYYGAVGMPLWYEFAFLRAWYRLERGVEGDELLIERDLTELRKNARTPDWRCRIALLETLITLASAGKEGTTAALISCSTQIEETSAILVESNYPGFSWMLFSRYARLLRVPAGRMATGFALEAYSEACKAGAFGLARRFAVGFESMVDSMFSAGRLQRPPATLDTLPTSTIPSSRLERKQEASHTEDSVGSRLNLSTVLRSLLLIAAEKDPAVLSVRLMTILLQFTRADYGALALRDASTGELALQSAGDFDDIMALDLKLSNPSAASFAPVSTMLQVEGAQGATSSRSRTTPLNDPFYDDRPSPAFYVVTPLRSGVLFLSSASDFLLDLESKDALAVVEAIANIAAIGIDASITRRSLETTVSERTAALSQALSAERSFLNVVSHELRTPLFAILGLVTVLETSDGLNGLQVEHLSQIKSSGEDLSRLIEQVLDFSRLQSGVEVESIPFNVRDIVESALDAVSTASQLKGLEVVYDVPVSKDIGLLNGDPFRVKQILMNFLSNAVKFTNTGSIKVSVERVESESEPPLVQISVRDSGVGITPAQQARLFQSFSQADASIMRSHGGAGLGLAISKGLAIALGGDAWVESTPKLGSTFLFSFSLRENDSQPVINPFKPLAGSTPRHIFVYACPSELGSSLQQNLSDFGLIPTMSSTRAGRKVKDNLKAALSSQPLDDEGHPIPFEVMLIFPEAVDKADISELRTLQAQARVVVMPTMLTASAEASRLEVPHKSILARPVKAQALYKACHRDDDVSSNGRCASDVKNSKRIKQKLLDREFALRHPIASCLYVDDNKVNVKVGCRLLESLGYKNIDAAYDGKQAIEAAATKPFELILMDLQMPVLDGFSAAKGIFANSGTADHPLIVALTANADENNREIALQTGFADFLSKPINMDRFKHVLRSVSHQKRQKIEDDEDSDTGYGGWKERHGGRDHKDKDVPDKDLDRRKEG